MLLAKKCLDTKSLRCLDAHSSSPFPTLNCAPKNNNNNKTTTKIGESRTPNINVQFPVLKLVWTLHKWQNCSTQFFSNFTLWKKKNFEHLQIWDYQILHTQFKFDIKTNRMHEDTKFKQVSTACNFKVLCKKIETTEGPMCNLQFLTKNNCDIYKKLRESILSTKNSVNWLLHPLFIILKKSAK